MKYEFTPLDVAAAVAIIVARWGCGLIVVASLFFLWVGLPV